MSMAQNIDKNIVAVIKEHDSLEIYQNGKKVKCSLSGHEMPCRLDVIQCYLQGKKYRSVKARHDLEQEINMQHLIASTKKRYGQQPQLFCKLTGRLVNDQPLHIRRHMDGRRFKKALLRWHECQRTGEEFKTRQPLMKNKNGTEKMETDGDEDVAEESSEDEDEEEDGTDEDVKDMEDLLSDSGSGSSSECEEEMQEAMQDESEESDYDVEALVSQTTVKTAKPPPSEKPSSTTNIKRKQPKEENDSNKKKLKTSNQEVGKKKKKKT